MKRLILVATALALSVTFARADDVPASIPDSNLDIGVGDWDSPGRIGFQSSLDGRCSKAWASRSERRPTQEADRRLIASKAVRGRIQVALDCALQAYGVERLKVYASEGDPLANYALALRSAQENEALCKSREEIVRQLVVAAEAAPSEALRAQGFWRRRRFPDAMFVAYQVNERCGQRAEANRALVLAGYYGYAPAFLINHIEPPPEPPR